MDQDQHTQEQHKEPELRTQIDMASPWVRRSYRDPGSWQSSAGFLGILVTPHLV
jgi:hypothetical protein